MYASTTHGISPSTRNVIGAKQKRKISQAKTCAQRKIRSVKKKRSAKWQEGLGTLKAVKQGEPIIEQDFHDGGERLNHE